MKMLSEAERYDRRNRALEELEKYQDAVKNIRMLEQRIEQLDEDMSSIKGIAYDKERVQSQVLNPGTMQAIIMDEKQECVKKIDENIRVMTHVKQQIYSLLDSDLQRRILIRYYVHGSTIEQIAVHEGYSYSQAKRLYGQAVDAFGEKMSPNEP